MSDDTPSAGPARPLQPARPAPASRPALRKRRGPVPAELALLRWLAAKPRPVTVGPVGNCVKRGWCRPVSTTVDDDDGRRPCIVYVVTEAGALLLSQHRPAGEGAGP